MPQHRETSSGVRREHRALVDSTNAAALAEARKGWRAPLWITADRQEVGRGRQGRRWVSEPGNLYASLLVIDPAPPHALPQLGLVAAVALARAIDAAGPLSEPVGLKWPNDAIVAGKKLSGMLLEAEVLNDHKTATVIGIGVNVVSAPEGLAYPTASTSSLGGVADPEVLFAALDVTLADALQEWARGEGFADIRRHWLERAVGLGGPLKVRLGDDMIVGTFRDLDTNGHLILEAEDGTSSTIAAGDVFFPDWPSGEDR